MGESRVKSLYEPSARVRLTKAAVLLGRNIPPGGRGQWEVVLAVFFSIEKKYGMEKKKEEKKLSESRGAGR